VTVKRPSVIRGGGERGLGLAEAQNVGKRAERRTIFEIYHMAYAIRNEGDENSARVSSYMLKKRLWSGGNNQYGVRMT